jgi:2'-hydroxyisoflavone reductase
MRILVLGGTRFLGRSIVEAALGRGHEVVLFNRGLTNPELFPALEKIKGDRRVDASMLTGLGFDVAIDVAAMKPEDVAPVLGVLGDEVGRYVFVSTVSVYADQSLPQVEGQPVLEQREGQDFAEAYGAGKAAAEQVVMDAFGERALVVRPGLIVGPHDPTDRFTYWPRRIARGGPVLAPGGPEHPAQFIDVRDLAAWIVVAAEQGDNGVFNATGHPTTLGELLGRCQAAITASRSRLLWVGDDVLLGAGLEPWMGIPLWIAAADWEGASDVRIDKALAKGLCFRALDETIRDTLAWDLARGGPGAGSEGLSAEAESELLATLAGRDGPSSQR